MNCTIDLYSKSCKECYSGRKCVYLITIQFFLAFFFSFNITFFLSLLCPLNSFADALIRDQMCHVCMFANVRCAIVSGVCVCAHFEWDLNFNRFFMRGQIFLHSSKWIFLLCFTTVIDLDNWVFMYIKTRYNV